MTKAIGYGLFFLALASPALASARYVEVWNPPEARGEVQPLQPVGKAPRHRRASVHIARGQLPHRIAAAAPGPKASVAAVGHRARAPRYEDIPRQVTPEGNVLRVDGHRAQARVER
ncbi:hypothetical protein [Paraburkholderia sp. BL10I2N1]|uniref:hypothetical protein n=1 Tax=Paraburkholderia sp. BL10I2N1 TaxID=1938796 RepID=UPI00105F1757|nr:hypothetical protein [Paraburkholderia sp. BL10I2N1]TDN59119.1 hypothetical protein B0G77_8310 [Paraburkholderia sp. BL10I2N1]